MFEFSEFEMLSLEQKAKMIWDNGMYLETISYYSHLVNIYALNRIMNYYYAEVYFDPVENSIVKIQLIDEIDLNKFIVGIDIKDIANSAKR
jgi:hypothetical protein